MNKKSLAQQGTKDLSAVPPRLPDLLAIPNHIRATLGRANGRNPLPAEGSHDPGHRRCLPRGVIGEFSRPMCSAGTLPGLHPSPGSLAVGLILLP